MDYLFPKVLVLNVNFNSIGSGITIRNLFFSWPKTMLGNAAIQVIEDKKITDTYFQLLTENNIVFKKTEKPNLSYDQKQILDNYAFRRGFIKNLSIGIKNFLEQKRLINRIIIDDRLVNWILINKFDIIYSVPFISRDIPFLIKLKEKTNIPLARVLS